MLKKIIKKRAYEGNKIEDNLLFVTLQTQIVGLDMNNGYEQIFLSDKLLSFKNRPQPSATIPKIAKKIAILKAILLFLGYNKLLPPLFFEKSDVTVSL